MEQSTSIPADRPAIHLTVSECDKLSELALNAQQRHPMASTLLLSDHDQAELHHTTAFDDADETPERQKC